MADPTPPPPPGRATSSSAQTAAAATSGSATQGAASQDAPEYLTKDMLPVHMIRFADHITADWIRGRNDIDTTSATMTQIDNKIAYQYALYVELSMKFEGLRRTFCEDFEYWTLEMWMRASTRTRQAMRDLLTDNAIHVGGGPGRNSIAVGLHNVVAQYMHGDSQQEEEPQESKSNLHFNEQGDLVTDDGNERKTSFQQDLESQQAKLAGMTAKLEAALDITAKLEAAHLDNSNPKQGSSSKASEISTWMPSSFEAIGISEDQIRRCISDIGK
ncbi:hypothetical protein E4U51_000818, partial [Claviceps purpurea]